MPITDIADDALIYAYRNNMVNNPRRRDQERGRGPGRLGIALGVGVTGAVAYRMLPPEGRKILGEGGSMVKSGMRGTYRGVKMMGREFNTFYQESIITALGTPERNAAKRMEKWAAEEVNGYQALRHHLLDRPGSLFGPTKYNMFHMSAARHLATAPKSAMRGFLQELPYFGGVGSVISMALAANTHGNPYQNYASNILGATLGAGGFRVGAAIGTAMRIPFGNVIGGGILGAIMAVSGGLAIDGALAVARWGAKHRYTSFNQTFVDSAGAATMRQASLQAIRNTELNNRNFILGNEARIIMNH